MLHMKRKATGGMNHVLVSLEIQNWDRVRSLWELLVWGRLLSILNWQTGCVSSMVPSEQTSNLEPYIHQSPWVTPFLGVMLQAAQSELFSTVHVGTLHCSSASKLGPLDSIRTSTEMSQEFSHWFDIKGIERLICNCAFDSFQNYRFTRGVCGYRR